MPGDVYEIATDSLVALSVRKTSSEKSNLRETSSSQRFQGEPLLNWREMIDAGLSRYFVGEAVYQYCLSESSTRAFVLFSLSKEVTRNVILELVDTKGLKIIYASDIELNQVAGQNLIELCYGHNSWMTRDVLKLMTRERLGVKPRAYVVFFTGWEESYSSVTELKGRLRGALPPHRFQRKLHGTDEHPDTMVLAEALTNPNTLDLLNRAYVSRADPLFSRLPLALKNQSNVCIDGSSVLELYGLRAARDIDLLIANQDAEERVRSIHFDPRNEKYREFPLKIPEIIESPFTTLRLFGYKFLTLRLRELFLSFEASSNSHPHLVAKAQRDLRSIAYFYSGNERKRLAFSIYVGTMLTQLRILFEFLLTRVLPILPNRLVEILRRIWRFIVKR